MRSRAGSLKKDIESKLGISPKLRWGSVGQLDVLVDGNTVFSHQQSGRMPSSEEILAILKVQSKSQTTK